MELKQRIILRADGNSRIGLGHVIRSLALAQMLRDEYECVFAIQAPDSTLRQQIQSICHGIIILPACSPDEDRFFHELDAYVSEEEIVVLDGYNFTTKYQQSIKNRGATLVCIDDIHSYHFVADVVINPAGGMEKQMYSTAPYTKVYLGPAYAMLRAPFLEAAKTAAAPENKSLRILLCMGGADPENHTLKIAAEIQHIHDSLELEIVVGSAYKHKQTLNHWVEKHPHHQVHSNLSAKEMCELMQKCPVAVTSASGVAYEYAAVGGALYILQTAGNQKLLKNYLLAENLAKDYSMFAEEIRSEGIMQTNTAMVSRQRNVFDGKSDQRLQDIFARLSLQTNLRIRQVIPEDSMLLYSWANDPEVRKHSFNSAAIPLDIHKSWFSTKFESADSLLYIAEVKNKPAAHIRFEITDHKATISYLISGEFRGRGLGHSVLLRGLDQLARDRKEINNVEGLVQATNPASVRAFEKAGFQKTTPEAAHPDAFKFTRKLHISQADQ